jgi:hypothetical protein
VFNIKCYFTSKSFAAVCEEFRNAYPGKEVLNKTALVTEFWDTGSVCEAGRARPILQTLEAQGPQLNHPKTLKGMLLSIKLFVITGLPPPYVVFHIA